MITCLIYYFVLFHFISTIRDVISTNFLQIDSIVSFKTVRDFYGSTSQSVGCDTINTESEFQFKYSGDENILKLMWIKLLNIGMNSHSWTTYDENIYRVSSNNSNGNMKSPYSPRVMLTRNKYSFNNYSNNNNYNSENTNSNNDKYNNISNSNGSNDSNNYNNNVVMSSSGYSSGENEKFAKILLCGTLLRKKDILAGWQSRYFVLQHDRLSYFIDENNFRKGK